MNWQNPLRSNETCRPKYFSKKLMSCLPLFLVGKKVSTRRHNYGNDSHDPVANFLEKYNPVRNYDPVLKLFEKKIMTP